MAEKDINVTFGSQSTRVDICKEAFIIDNNDLISPAMLKTLLLLAYKAGQDEVENRPSPIIRNAPR